MDLVGGILDSLASLELRFNRYVTAGPRMDIKNSPYIADDITIPTLCVFEPFSAAAILVFQN